MSADVFRFKRGTTAQVNAYLPALGEPVFDTTLKQLKIGDGVAFGGVASANAATADKLTTARDIAITGMLTGSASFDGSANVSINTVVAGPLQVLLDAKADLASPALSGTPTTPTAAVDTNTTQVASTAYVLGQAASATPIVDGTGAVGTSLRYARQDHVHPTDTSRAATASPTFTGVPLSTTPAVGTNTTQIATAAMVQAEIANKRTWTNFTPTVTATTGTFTSTTATGKYMVAYGICHVQMTLLVTTVGTGTKPILTLPFPALAGSRGVTLPAAENDINGKVGGAAIGTSLLAVTLRDYNNLDLVTANGCFIVINGSYPIA